MGLWQGVNPTRGAHQAHAGVKQARGKRSCIIKKGVINAMWPASREYTPPEAPQARDSALLKRGINIMWYASREYTPPKAPTRHTLGSSRLEARSCIIKRRD